MTLKRDHGGGLDAVLLRNGGTRADWPGFSTGINPVAYRGEKIPAQAWNEHAAAFEASGLGIGDTSPTAQVAVRPNNRDGRVWTDAELTAPFTVTDESFCDISPERSLIHLATRPGTLIPKSFGKFWGLAGQLLGFAIGDPKMIARLAELIGIWPLSGPALKIGARALADKDWASANRARLATEAAWRDRLAQAHSWTRVFPYSDGWLRLGLPALNQWAQREGAL